MHTNVNVNFDHKPKYQSRYPNPAELWQQVYNMVDSKVYRLSWAAFVSANRGKKTHVAYSLPDEAEDMVKMLRELMSGECSGERCEEIAAFATSPAVNQLIYGRA